MNPHVGLIPAAVAFFIGLLLLAILVRILVGDAIERAAARWRERQPCPPFYPVASFPWYVRWADRQAAIRARRKK